MVSHEPPIRVMALHALAYCERLFYLEEVEEIRVADAAVYAGRAEHERLRSGGSGTDTRSMDLYSERLGLIGRVDAVRRRDGVWITLEIKRGRARREGSTPVAWPSDALQAAAYAMLLEEKLGVSVPEAHIRYLADDVTVMIPVDNHLREAVLAAVQRARELRRSLNRPPVTTNDRLCLRCSLAPVCLPEEERLAKEPEWIPVRLYPPAREGRVLHVTDHRWRVGRSGDSLVLLSDGERLTYPIHEIEAVVIHGHAQITTQALLACAANGVSVHWITSGGHYVGALSVGAGPVHRRLRQYEALSRPEFRLELSKRLAVAKVESQLRYLLRATRGGQRPAEWADRLEQIRRALRTIARAATPDEIRGAEGAAARVYFESLPLLLSERVPQAMRPAGRSRRPPQDRFNALLSFGYSLLYQAVLRSIIVVAQTICQHVLSIVRLCRTENIEDRIIRTGAVLSCV